MSLHQKIDAYRQLAEQRIAIEQRQEVLRQRILDEMCRRNIRVVTTTTGIARFNLRHKLTPRADAVLALLSAVELLPFCRFTTGRVRELLVGKHGREKVLPLFDIEELPVLSIHALDQELARTEAGAGERSRASAGEIDSAIVTS